MHTFINYTLNYLMSESKFFKSFLASALALTILIIYINQNSYYHKYQDLSYIGLAVFSIYTIIVYYIAKVFSEKSWNTKFIKLIYINFLIKLIITIIIPLSYYYLKGQPTGNFVLPFLIIYIVFTIYSTWMLNKMVVLR